MNTQEIVKKIKDFTKKAPKDTSEFDTRYREYLAKGSKLLDYDLELVNLERYDDDDEKRERIEEIRLEVNEIVNSI